MNLEPDTVFADLSWSRYQSLLFHLPYWISFLVYFPVFDLSDCSVCTGYTSTIRRKNGKLSELIGELQRLLLSVSTKCGAVIVNRPDELQQSDVGTGAGIFEVKKIGDEFFAFFVDCKEPKACTVLLRGPSKDLLNEVERNLQDAMSVARNILNNPKLVPGGGATELTVSATLKQKSSSVEGIKKWPYEAAAIALEAIPRTLALNCGVNVITTMTALHGKHANGENAWIGIDGNTGVITDVKEKKIWDAYNKKQPPGAKAPSKPQVETEGDADNEQIIPE
ncbi:hypothetical protein L3X38_042455 [Prunus dulcis]|uniref:TCP-1/cpn60 chaperonin family protein n=1 Tax=Prunus dulcis TaxID=3755 RepID=A0AAD4YL89_PRUDU|nr:hypothetical protein L3X38_042455 [Prunus dulcis]